MRKTLLNILSVSGLMLLASTFSVTEAKAQNVLGEILRRMDAHNKALQSLRANATMEKYNSQLKIKDPYSGTAIYLAKSPKNDRCIRLNWEKPTVEQMAVVGENYELYKRSINTLYYGKVSNVTSGSGSASNALAFLNMSRDQMKANYEIAYLGEDTVGSLKTWHLQLTPKDAKKYKLAEIWVDADGMPRQEKNIEKNDDTTTVTLSNITKNGNIKGIEFHLDYPKNVGKVHG